MASYILVDRNGRQVGMATDRAEFATLAIGSPHMAPMLAGVDNSISGIERYANSSEGRAFERAWSKFWLTILFSVVVIVTWCLPLFFRTLFHPVVIAKYRRNAWITLAVGLAGLAVSAITLAMGMWHMADGLGFWSWCSVGLGTIGFLALAMSIVQRAISAAFPAAALSSGTGWPCLLGLMMGLKSSWFWTGCQDIGLWVITFITLTVLTHDPIFAAIFASVGLFILLIPVWIMGWANSLQAVPAE